MSRLDTIQVRADTAAAWTAVNPVLLDGEPGFERTTGTAWKLKIGDGVTAWTALAYVGGTGGTGGAVTSVAGRTGAVVLAVADVTNAVAITDGRLSDARIPTAHKTGHAPGGTDAIDYTVVNLAGTLAARPAAAAANAGLIYFATDDNGGSLYRSTGAAWVATAKGLTAAPTTHAGTHLPAGADAIDFAGKVLGYGLASARPAASLALAGLLYMASDIGALWRCKADGSGWDLLLHAPGRMVRGGTYRETYDARYGANAASPVPGSGILLAVAVELYAGDVVNKFTVCSGTTALAGGTHAWGVLLDPTGAQVAVTADDTAPTWAGGTLKDFTFASAYTVATSGVYYLGIVLVATTMPTLRGQVTAVAISGATGWPTGKKITVASAGSGLLAPSANGTAYALAAYSSSFYAMTS